MVPFMFVGFDVIPQSAEEIDIPFSDIGRMLMLSIGLAVTWYVLIILAVSMGLPAEFTSCLRVTDCGRNGCSICWCMGRQVAGDCRYWRHSYQLECVPDRWQQGDICSGKGRTVAGGTGTFAPAIQHPAQGDFADRRIVCLRTTVWPPGTGLAGRCRGSRHRLGICIRCGFIPGIAAA